MTEQSLLTNTILRVVDLLEDEIDERKRKGLTTREFELATAKTEEDIIKLCHYTNLQLLKAKDNLRKNAKNDWRLDDVK